jgi:hypothetical protein
MLRRALASLAVCFAVASAAAAGEFVPGIDAFSAWESNVFATNQNEQSDFSGLVGPNLELRQLSGALQYDIHYKMHYEAFATLNGINDFQHFLNATGSYDLSPATEVSIRNDFQKTSSAQQIFTSTAASSGIVQVGQTDTRREVESNNAVLTIVHHLTPTWQLQTSFENVLYNYPKNNQLQVAQFGSTSMEGSTQLMHALSPRLVVGVGTAVTRQQFDSQNGVKGRGATIYQGYGVLNYSVTPTFSVFFSGGPAMNDPDQVVSKVPVNTFPGPATGATFAGRNVQFAIDPATCPTQNGLHVLNLTNNLCRISETIVPTTTPGVFERSPVLLLSNEATKVDFVGSQQQASGALTYYGRIGFDKRWETASAGLEYDRSASTASGFGASTNLDSISGYVRWTPTQEWTVQLSVGGYRQASASKVQQPQSLVVEANSAPADLGVLVDGSLCPTAPGMLGTQVICPVGQVAGVVAQTVGATSRLVNSNLEFITYTAGINASRRVNKYLTLVGSVNWWLQDTKGDVALQGPSTRQDWRIQMGFTWTFEPIRLPSPGNPL